MWFGLRQPSGDGLLILMFSVVQVRKVLRAMRTVVLLAALPKSQSLISSLRPKPWVLAQVFLVLRRFAV